MNRRVRILAASPDGIRLGPRTQPDDAISTGVAGKSVGKKEKSPRFTDGACSKCAIQRRYQKHGSPGRIVLMANGGELGR